MLLARPYFTLHIQTQSVIYETFVNGGFVAADYAGTSTSETWPVNQWLRLGHNDISMMVYPWPNEKGDPDRFEANAEVELTLLVRPSGSPDAAQHEIARLSFAAAGLATRDALRGSAPPGHLDSSRNFERVQTGDVLVSTAQMKQVGRRGGWMVSQGVDAPIPFAA